MEYYSAINRNERTIPTIAWVDLEVIMLCEEANLKDHIVPHLFDSI